MTAQIIEIRSGVSETDKIVNVDREEDKWRRRMVGHVQKQVPAFRHEQSVPVSQVSPLDSQTVKQSGAVLTEEADLDARITGSDVIHLVNSAPEHFTGAKRWLRYMRGMFGKKLTEKRRAQKEQAKKNIVEDDYEGNAA